MKNTSVIRQCGDCTLCCKLLPVPPLGKGANERCKHQRHTGCRVYHKAGMPLECVLWNCRWLVDNAGGTSRPDRSHVVIDVMPDYVDAVMHDGNTNTIRLEVIQCWVDPRHPNAHRDPALRAYLLKEAQENGRAALIRYDANKAFILLAPPLNSTSEWAEIHGESAGRTHSLLEIATALTEG